MASKAAPGGGTVGSYQRQAIEAYLATQPPDTPIAAVVASRDVEERIGAFERADVAAVEHQTSYRRMYRFALWTTTVGAITGALSLLPVGALEAGAARLATGVLQTSSIIATFLALRWIAYSKPIAKWQGHRAEAESQRGRIFAAIAAAAPAAGLPRQKLELIKAAYIDDQLRYFEKAIVRHRTAAGSLTIPRLLAYVLTAIVVVLALIGIAGLLPASLLDPGSAVARLAAAARGYLDQPARWQLGLGAIASSIFAHASARSLMDQDERNAALYANTVARLRQYLAEHDTAVRAAAANDAAAGDAAVRAYFRDARAILQAEHTAWLLARPAENPAAGAATDLPGAVR